jgi:hypothetical protein
MIFVEFVDIHKSSTCGDPVFPTAFVEETIFSPMYVIGAFVENQMAAVVWTCFWAFCSFH